MHEKQDEKFAMLEEQSSGLMNQANCELNLHETKAVNVVQTPAYGVNQSKS